MQHKKTVDRTQNKDYSKYLKLINDVFPKVNKVLCVGSRDQKEVLDFRKAGYDAIGIDLYSINENVVQILDMHDIDTKFNENEFDVIFSCHSLEHAYDPKKVLMNFRKVATHGCFIVLPFQTLPNEKDPVIFNFMESKDYTHDLISSEFEELIEDKISLKHFSIEKNDGYFIALDWYSEIK